MGASQEGWVPSEPTATGVGRAWAHAWLGVSLLRNYEPVCKPLPSLLSPVKLV